jgi:hypothetical protein
MCTPCPSVLLSCPYRYTVRLRHALASQRVGYGRGIEMCRVAGECECVGKSQQDVQSLQCEYDCAVA